MRSRLISVLMTQAGIYGLPGPARIKRLRGVVTADDLVNRKFHRLHPNELWVTDIERHEAFLDLAVVKGHRSMPVAAGVR